MSTIIDPASSAFWLSGIHDTEYHNLKFAGVFGLRGATNVLIKDGTIGGQPGSPIASPGCLIGGVQAGARSSHVTVQGVHIHDIDPEHAGDHHEGIYVSCADFVSLLDLVIERVFANTADIFFTGWETTGVAKDVVVRGCDFYKPTNGTGSDAMQWNDSKGAFANFLIEGNRFNGCQMNFGTLTKGVANFVVGINYGDTPSAAQVAAAKAVGVQFLELPFRPAAQWPGAGATPPPPVVTPPPVVQPPVTPPVTPPPSSPALVTVSAAGVTASKLLAALAAHGGAITLTRNGKPIATVKTAP